MEISVVIPAYNEIERLPPTLDIIREFLNANFSSWEIIVSDDGSTDGSVSSLRTQMTDVKFLVAPRNQGKGAAVRRGMLEARGDLALFTDADLSTPIDELLPLRAAMETGGADVVIASRALPESVLVVHQPWWRELSGKLFNRVVRPLSGLPFCDTQCGFKLFTREAAQAIFSKTRSNGWAFDVEALILASMLGYKIEEVPVRWINAEGSKVNFMIDGPRMVLDIVRFRWWRFKGLYQ